MRELSKCMLVTAWLWHHTNFASQCKLIGEPYQSVLSLCRIQICSTSAVWTEFLSPFIKQSNTTAGCRLGLRRCWWVRKAFKGYIHFFSWFRTVLSTLGLLISNSYSGMPLWRQSGKIQKSHNTCFWCLNKTSWLRKNGWNKPFHSECPSYQTMKSGKKYSIAAFCRREWSSLVTEKLHLTKKTGKAR